MVLVSCESERVLGPPKAVAVAEDGRMELQLVSFNLRYENDGDQGVHAWRNRVRHVVRAVREEAPDVMGVQEALHGQAADLWASLPDYEFFGMGRDDGRREGEYAGLFYRRDRFEADLTDGGIFWLSGTPETPGSKTWGNGIPRVATWLRLVDRRTQRGFYVFNTHWDHRHQGSREKAAELIARRIAGRRHGEEPVVLMGDFNATEENPALRQLTGGDSGLLETFEAANPGEPNRTSLHFWKGSKAGRRKIDHILVSPGAQVLSADVRAKDQPMVSDHFPVTARVVFSN